MVILPANLLDAYVIGFITRSHAPTFALAIAIYSKLVIGGALLDLGVVGLAVQTFQEVVDGELGVDDLQTLAEMVIVVMSAANGAGVVQVAQVLVRDGVGALR